MMLTRQPLTFCCEGETLVGVITRPAVCAGRGVMVVVGGPQYRVGSHRQFALLSNYLAEQGSPVMRFDYRGMGDSTGELHSFEDVASDLRAAMDAFLGAVPELREVVLWGLCDAASAVLLHAHADPRVAGMVLLNPWVRSARSEARAYLRHYYMQRLFSGAALRKLLTAQMDVRRSARALLHNVRAAVGHRAAPSGPGWDASRAGERMPLSDRMAEALARFRGPVLIILSGQDLTAQEFVDVSAASRRWRRLLGAARVSRIVISEATHTFSRRVWRDRVATSTAGWIRSW